MAQEERGFHWLHHDTFAADQLHYVRNVRILHDSVIGHYPVEVVVQLLHLDSLLGVDVGYFTSHHGEQEDLLMNDFVVLEIVHQGGWYAIRRSRHEHGCSGDAT